VVCLEHDVQVSVWLWGKFIIVFLFTDAYIWKNW